MTKTKEIRNYLEMYGLDKSTQDICDAVGCAPRTVQQVRKDYRKEHKEWLLAEAALAKAEVIRLLDLAAGSSNLDYMCEGCEKADMTLFKCTVYNELPSYYVRRGCCPFNQETKQPTKRKVRVGQQKQKRF